MVTPATVTVVVVRFPFSDLVEAQGSSSRCARRERVDSAALGYTRDMEVTLSADLQAKLARVAYERGTEPQALAQEAIERLVDYDDWFLREVVTGLAQVERGQTVSHGEVGTRLEQRLTEQTRRR